MTTARVAFTIELADSEPRVDAARALVKKYVEEITDGDEARAVAAAATLLGGFAAPTGGFWIARDDDAALGCVGVRDIGDGACELKRMYVVPAARGRGVASALTKTAIAFARACGYARMRLGTLHSMHDAQRLYERLGFVRIPAYRREEFGTTWYYELDLGPPHGAPSR